MPTTSEDYVSLVILKLILRSTILFHFREPVHQSAGPTIVRKCPTTLVK